jgi:orotidine-5'-phosphate decarboxylase
MLGVKICSEIELRGITGAYPIPRGGLDVFADLKLYGTAADIARRVDNLARTKIPNYLTVAGDATEAGVSAAVKAAGSMQIVVVPMLSTMTPAMCFAHYHRGVELVFLDRVVMALEARASAITCPAWLLQNLNAELAYHSYKRPFVIATGIRMHPKQWEKPGDHWEPQTPEWALQNGADAVIMENDILGAFSPADAYDEAIRRIAMVEKVAV